MTNPNPIKRCKSCKTNKPSTEYYETYWYTCKSCHSQIEKQKRKAQKLKRKDNKPKESIHIKYRLGKNGSGGRKPTIDPLIYFEPQDYKDITLYHQNGLSIEIIAELFDVETQIIQKALNI